MNNEDALKKAESDLKVLDLSCSHDTNQQKFLRTAIKALDKQVSKKILYSGDGYSDGSLVYDMANCPACDYFFEESDDCWEADYCPNCGQRLDWTFDEEE